MNSVLRHSFARIATLVIGLGLAVASQAQSASYYTGRDISQQQRIEQGLQSGQLDTREAAQLEREESAIDRTERRDLRDGSLSASDRAQLQNEQNAVSRQIYQDRHNGTLGNPDSRSSERMQQVVGRDVHQEQRINNGVRNGSLTNRELGRMEGGQAWQDYRQYRYGRDNHFGRWEQRSENRLQNRNSNRIWWNKHNGRNR